MRLSPLTDITNKHLLTVFDREMIFYPLETLLSLGARDILIVSGQENMDKFFELLGDGSAHGARISYGIQKESGGIAQALDVARDFVGGDKSITILGYNIFDNASLPKEAVTAWAESGSDAVVFMKEVHDPCRFGVPEIIDGRIIGIEEKPKNPKSSFAITGLYLYPPDVFDIIKTIKPSRRGELEITDVNNKYIEKGRCRYAHVPGFWIDAGTYNSIMSAASWAKERTIKSKVQAI